MFVPITDVRDWLLYGRHFDHMKFGRVPISAGRDLPLSGRQLGGMKFGCVSEKERQENRQKVLLLGLSSRSQII